MATEISSPPYPGEGTNPDLLFKYLGDLAEWVAEHREDYNEAVGRDVITPGRPFPAKTVYLAQPVAAMWYHFIVMRRIREEWDHLVRTYEDSWDCAACGRQKLVLVQTANMLIDGAFVPFEQREAMREREVEQMTRMWENLKTTLLGVMDPKYHDTQHSPNNESDTEPGDDGG